MNSKQNRREFLAAGASLAAAVALDAFSAPIYGAVDANSKPAILGGDAIKYDAGPAWPFFAGNEVERLTEVFESRQWNRGDESSPTVVFENDFAKLLGSKFGLAVSSGTTALQTALSAHDVGPGDEVIVTPYTYVASVNCILESYALPVFADVDAETFQLDASEAEKRINENTQALLPVHIGGAPADMDAFLELGKKRDIPVIEDACQAVMGEWKGRKLGTLGSLGCFSMQISKNLCGGEGGVVLTDDEFLAYKVLDAHTHGFLPHSGRSLDEYRPVRASNYRMTGFQGAILSAQLPHIAAQADVRNENALYLSSLLRDIPGVYPQRIYGGGRSAWHLYMFRIEEEEFGLSRDGLIQALLADGVPCYGGYQSCDWTGYVRKSLDTRAGRRVYSKERLDAWEEATSLPRFHKLSKEAVWLFQYQLLAPKENMDAIADAVRRIKKYAPDIKKALA